MVNVYPADAVAQRALQLLAILQPKLPISIISDNYRFDLFDNYLHQVFPESPQVEPDTATRNHNIAVQSAVRAVKDETDLVINDSGVVFQATQTFGYFLSDGEGSYNGTQTNLTGDVNLQNKLLDIDNMDNIEKLDLSDDIRQYIAFNLVDTGIFNQNPATVSNGNQYRTMMFDLLPYIIDLINQMDDLVLPYYLAEFGGSCSATDDPPDQPNSPTLANVTDTSVTILIGESICSHNDPIDHYKVFRRISGEGNFVEIDQHTNLADLNYTDTTLLPNTAYEFNFKAHNAQGDSIASNNLEIITLQDPNPPNDPPENLVDFLNQIVSEISDLLNGIFLGLTELSADKLFEMKMLEVLLSATANGSINDKAITATNALALQKQIKLIAESATAPDIGE